MDREKHVLRGAPEPVHADGDATVHPPDQWLLKEGGTTCFSALSISPTTFIRIHTGLRVAPAMDGSRPDG